MLTLLNTIEDWDKYREEFCRERSLEGKTVYWGTGPASYPCLATSCPIEGNLILSCYVYENDARRLLGLVTEAAQASAAAQESCTVPTRSAPGQDNFKRFVTASMLTLAWFVVESGLAKDKQYEERFNRFSHLVDQWLQHDKEQEAVLGLSKLESSMLEQLWSSESNS